MKICPLNVPGSGGASCTPKEFVASFVTIVFGTHRRTARASSPIVTCIAPVVNWSGLVTNR